MKYELSIREHNKKPHVDIEHDVQEKKNGLFTFILRVNNGNIVDYSVMEYADARKYLVLKQIVIEEHTVARYSGVGSKPDPIRSDNHQRRAEEWSSTDRDD